MDGIIIIILALGILLFDTKSNSNDAEAPIMKKYTNVTKTREPRLNPTFYEDPDAFMDIAHGLGFHNGDNL